MIFGYEDMAKIFKKKLMRDKMIWKRKECMEWGVVWCI